MDTINQNPHASVVLTKKALQIILAQTVGLLDREDRDELSNALSYCHDQQKLEQNAVSTPLKFYK